jgi:hypothetical protein
MSDSRKSQPGVPTASAPPVRDRVSIAREGRENFKKNLFAHGAHFEECFRKICDAGCPTEQFGEVLWSTCVLMSFKSIPLLDGGNLSRAQLKGLPKRLRSMADIITALNSTRLGPANEINLMPPAEEASRAQIARDWLINRYAMLPNLLYFYALHIERFTKIARTAYKRLTVEHVLAMQILRYVEARTGSPHYADLAELLERGCSIEGNNVPRFLTPEGLAKLYQRWVTISTNPK